MDIATLTRGLEARLVGRAAGVGVRGVTEDSRRVRPGWAFVARAGVRCDGRAFIADAIRAGAVAVISDREPAELGGACLILHEDPARVGAVMAERLAGDPTSSLDLVGVTGTNGKTTVATLIYQMCRLAGVRCGLVGTVEADDGSGPVVSDFTTPPAERLSALFGRMVANGCRAAAMEVSSHALDQRRVAGLHFRAGVFTNLTGDHLDYHGDMAAYEAAKRRLFEQLEPGSSAIVNADDAAGERMLARTRARPLRCRAGRLGSQDGGEAAGVETRGSSANGMELALSGPWGRIVARTRLIGAHNAMNLLQATGAAVLALGIEPARVAEIIPELTAPAGRLEPVHAGGDDIAVLVDFAHTDDALRNALRAARAATPKGARLWVVFGCGGDKDRTKRPRMGRAAAELADRVVITSDNPRTEAPEVIIDEVLAGVPGEARTRVMRTADRREAIAIAIADAAPGDVVLIAGKGHEREQILPDGAGGTRRVPFDDHAEARAALAARREPANTVASRPA